jgi:hypothetical protein
MQVIIGSIGEVAEARLSRRAVRRFGLPVLGCQMMDFSNVKDKFGARAATKVVAPLSRQRIENRHGCVFDHGLDGAA